MNNLAVDALISKRADLVREQARINEQYNKQILDIESAIEKLSGEKSWEIPIIDKFDDESHSYIKGSFEEM